MILKPARPILRKNIGTIRVLIRETQDRFGARLKALAIMEDHVHLVVKVSKRRQLADSLRFLAGQIALKITKGKLWRARAWSRPVVARRDLQTVMLYVARNPMKGGRWSLADAFIIVDGVLQV